VFKKRKVSSCLALGTTLDASSFRPRPINDESVRCVKSPQRLPTQKDGTNTTTQVSKPGLHLAHAPCRHKTCSCQPPPTAK